MWFVFIVPFCWKKTWKNTTYSILTFSTDEEEEQRKQKRVRQDVFLQVPCTSRAPSPQIQHQPCAHSDSMISDEELQVICWHWRLQPKTFVNTPLLLIAAVMLLLMCEMSFLPTADLLWRESAAYWRFTSNWCKPAKSGWRAASSKHDLCTWHGRWSELFQSRQWDDQW